MQESPYQMDDLEINWQTPFETALHVGRPNVGHVDRFMERVRGIFERRWFTNNGSLVQEFESELRAFTGARHCIPICNATVALELASRALDLQGEVIVPSFTFVATPHSLSWQGITPVFCDVDPVTHNLDIDKIEALITPRTTGILAVHVWGRPVDIERLEDIAQKHRLKLLFDAAHAFGCSYKGQMIGNFGAAEVFSFHSTKFFNTFEGGAIATNDDDLAARIRLMKNFGFAGPDRVIYPGTNGKMTEIVAAMGLTSLESLDEFIETNQRNYHQYRCLLADVPGMSVVAYDAAERNNFQYIIAELDASVAGVSRDALVEHLHQMNVLARRYFYPGCHKMEPYLSLYPHNRTLLPETDRLCEKVLSLPNGTAVSQADIAKICYLIKSFIAEHGAGASRQGEVLST